MGKFRLADMDVRSVGVDDLTPPGHCIATGLDPVGNLRVWLFEGNAPADETYRGNILIPQNAEGLVMAYGPRGAYARSGRDQAELLQYLADLERAED
jgi:hypothetical protein